MNRRRLLENAVISLFGVSHFSGQNKKIGEECEFSVHFLKGSLTSKMCGFFCFVLFFWFSQKIRTSSNLSVAIVVKSDII